MESLKKNARMVWRGAVCAVLALALLAAGWAGYHYGTSVSETNLDGLARNAARYLGGEALRVVDTERRGDYLAALCTDNTGGWCMCVYDREALFRDRWRGGGGKPTLKSGTLGSWNFGNPREAVIVFCGGDLPPEAAYYTFQNSGITYICPIENGRVLDLFLLPDTHDISSWPEQLLDKDGRPLPQTASESADTYVS